MATLADSFLQDLEDLEEEQDPDQDPTGKKGQKAKKTGDLIIAGDDSDDEIPDAIHVFELGEKSGSSSISEMLKNDEFQKLMDEVRERKDEQPALELGKQLSEEDTEYPLITRCNSLVREIDEEMLNIHRFVRDIYAKKFPELESIVTSPLDYLQVVQRIGNTKDLTSIDFSDILPNTAVMAITVTASMTAGTVLPRQELDKMLVACDEAFVLNDCKRDVLLYLESRMSGLAPNLSALLGAALAAKLITAAGGLLNLARMPAQNIMLVGSQKKALLGMATSAYHVQGIVMMSDLILSTPMEFRNRAVKLVAGKCGLAARVDSFHESPLGQVGTQLREKILQALAKAQEPPPAKQKKTLPPPEDKPRAKRGGKRHRRIKEKYGQSEFKKLVNRVKFGVDPEENIYTEEWGLGIPFFEGKPMPFKTAKVSTEVQGQEQGGGMQQVREQHQGGLGTQEQGGLGMQEAQEQGGDATGRQQGRVRSARARHDTVDDGTQSAASSVASSASVGTRRTAGDGSALLAPMIPEHSIPEPICLFFNPITMQVVGCTQGFTAKVGPLVFKGSLRDTMANYGTDFELWVEAECSKRLVKNRDLEKFELKLTADRNRPRPKFEFHADAYMCGAWQAARISEFGLEIPAEYNEEHARLCLMALRDVTAKWKRPKETGVHPSTAKTQGPLPRQYGVTL